MTILKLGETVKDFISKINANFAELVNKKSIGYTILFEGSVTIPSKSDGTFATITLIDEITNFDGVIIQRESTSAWEFIGDISIGSKFKVMSCEADFDLMEGCNLYMCNVEVTSATKVKAYNNVYAGIKTTAAGRYNVNFDERPITKIIGIKLNA